MIEGAIWVVCSLLADLRADFQKRAKEPYVFERVCAILFVVIAIVSIIKA